MVGHNNMIPNAHFHKKWARYVRVLFNQPLKKVARKFRRDKKMRKLAPRPVNKLRPLVRCPSARYNAKLRLGRGFSLSELAALKLSRKKCPGFGIPVDHRRRKSGNFAQQRINVERLKDYMNRLILYPKKAKGELKEPPVKTVTKIAFKPSAARKVVAYVPGEAEKKFSPYLLRRNLIGLNKKRRNKSKKLIE